MIYIITETPESFTVDRACELLFYLFNYSEGDKLLALLGERKRQLKMYSLSLRQYTSYPLKY